MSAMDDEEAARDEGEPETGPDAPSSSLHPVPLPAAPAVANAVALGVTLASAGVVAYAFDPARAGKGAMIGSIGALYAVLAALALRRLHRRGELRLLFRPAYGDVTLGAATAGVLYGCARIAGSILAAHGSPREMWLTWLYLQLGDPDAPGRTLVGVAVFAVAALEEIVWRGLVMRTQEEVMSPRRAALVSSLLYAAAHLPTLVLLRPPGGMLNPLVVLAALGCGLVWSFLVIRTGRLTPALLAHALFSWSIIEFPLWAP
jgi:membrane protease YdiL (CAAX protease family)